MGVSDKQDGGLATKPSKVADKGPHERARFPTDPLVPMARIERATSPLPRECSTTEPHGHRYGFDDAAASGLGKPVSTDQTLALERETGIEPASLAWKARV